MTMALTLETLPSDILHSDRAVVWKYETRDDRPTKVPYIASRTQQRAAVDDPATWSPFSVAVDAYFDGKCDGVGIVLGDGLWCIDLDHCRDRETGAIDPFAQSIISSLNSYTEVSPSGTGAHIWVRGESLAKGRRRPGIEVYSTLRYMTITGSHVAGTPQVIHDRSTQLAALHAQIFGPEPAPREAAATSSATLTDTELIIKASTAKNGGKFTALMAGDVSMYDGDDSAADQALVNLLAFWTQGNPDQIDRIFRQSKLFRLKWDSRRGETTYGQQTIAKAIADTTEMYSPVIDIDIEIDAPRSEPVIESVPSSRPSVADDWPTMHVDAFIGPIGALVQALRPVTEAHPAALLTTALVHWGNLVPRGPFAAVGANRHYLNENQVLVGPTASGGKGQAEAEVRSVMAEVDPTWATTCLSAGLSSGEGLINRVRDGADASMSSRARDQVVDAGVTDKRLLVVESEFAKTLRVSRRENNTLSAVVRQAWDDGELRVLTRHHPLTATNAHISLSCHITPLELRKELQTSEMANGFLNRFLIVLTRRQGYLPNGGCLDAAERAYYVQQLITAKQTAEHIGQLRRDHRAETYWTEIYPHVTRERAGLVGDVCSRAPAHILRLSLLYALSGQASEIRLDHLKAALAVWAYVEASARWIFSRRLGHRLADFLLALLRAYPNGLTRSDVSDKLGRNRKAEDIHDALQVLLDYGLARYVVEDSDGPGPKAHRWFAMETERSTN